MCWDVPAGSEVSAAPTSERGQSHPGNSHCPGSQALLLCLRGCSEPRQPHPGRGRGYTGSPIQAGEIQAACRAPRRCASNSYVALERWRGGSGLHTEVYAPHGSPDFLPLKKKNQQQNSRKLHLGANLHAQTHWFPQLLIQQPGTAKIQSSCTSSVVSPGAAR